MGRLSYSVIGSLDGYYADEAGSFDWAVPDDEVLAFVNEQERGVGTYLYGRRMYEVMAGWETDPSLADSPLNTDFAELWQAARKIVYSATLTEVVTRDTELRPAFDADEVRELKTRGDLNVAGPTLAASAFRAGLVDEFQLIAVPVVVGGGLRYFPDVRVPLTLRDTHRFGNGMVSLTYDVGVVVP